MKFRIKEIAFALLCLPLFAVAQAPTPIALPDLPAASSPGRTASGVPGRNPPQRLRSPAETGGSATAPGDLKPERPVAAPQISIPFGKKAPPPSTREERLVERGGAASAGGLDDAAARCDAQADAQVRADCRAKVLRQER